MCDGLEMKQVTDLTKEGFTWKEFSEGGVLEIIHSGKNLIILFR